MNFERQRQVRRAREREQDFEVERLKAAFERIIGAPVGDPGTPPTKEIRLGQLESLLRTEPQRGQDGLLRYLVTSGLAVEMITGFQRYHHDIDIVIMNPEDGHRWELLGTDNVTPGQYWADMKFNADYLETTARSVKTRRRGDSPTAEVVHPAIILVQKSSDAFGRPPRPRDNADVGAIVGHWKEREGYTRDWNPIVRDALDALPRNQFNKTLERLRKRLA